MELNNFDHNMELLNPNFMNDLKQKRSRGRKLRPFGAEWSVTGKELRFRA